MDSNPLNNIKKRFKNIKISEISEDKKAEKYAELMTEMENFYNIEIIGKNENVEKKVMKLYLEISNERKI